MCPWKHSDDVDVICQEKKIKYFSFGGKISGRMGNEIHCSGSPPPFSSKTLKGSLHAMDICYHSLLFCLQPCSPTLRSLFQSNLFSYSCNDHLKNLLNLPPNPHSCRALYSEFQTYSSCFLHIAAGSFLGISHQSLTPSLARCSHVTWGIILSKSEGRVHILYFPSP